MIADAIALAIIIVALVAYVNGLISISICRLVFVVVLLIKSGYAFHEIRTERSKNQI